MIEYIADTDHYNKVLAKVANVKQSLWIGTADIKDLHVKVGATTKPFLAVITLLIRRGVAVRCGSFMPKSPDRTSVPTLTAIQYFMTDWSEYSAHESTLRWWCSTARKCILAVRT